MEKKKYFDELNIFRALIIFWVVLGHSTHPDIGVLGYFHNYAYIFHMPAFFLLSGFLFTSKLKRCTSIKDSAKIIWDRAKRLLVPYLFFTAISYVLKMIFERYAYNELSGNILLNVLLGRNNPNGGLWFLYALFIISVVFILFNKLNDYILFAITLALRILVLFINIDFEPVMFFASYSVYFSAGIILQKHYEAISSFVKKKPNAIICAALTAISFALSYICIFVYYSKAFELAVCIFSIITWYYISICCNSVKFIKKPLMVIGNYGMDIYMLGYYVQTIIRVVIGTILGAPYVVFSVLMCIFGLLLPIPISKYIVRKVFIFRALMLGDFNKKKSD